MFKAVDPYTYTLTGQLGIEDKVVGLFKAAYQVTHYDDVQLSSGTVHTGVPNPGVRKYVLSVTQRVIVYNKNGLVLSPQDDVRTYPNYPALLNLQLTPETAKNVSLLLVGYSPQTVNTKVQTSGTTGTSSGQTNQSSTSNTVGSTTAQTNSFGVSVGTFADAFTFGMSSETSTTHSTEQSHTSTVGSGTSRSHESSSSAYMSIENWGAYALVNPETSSPVWTFGQEYPWDAIECRKTTNVPNPRDPGQVQLVVPSAMLVRLYDNVSLYPPSHLSMFGINFASQAQWLVTVDNAESDEVALEHVLEYFTATHSLVDKAAPHNDAMSAEPTSQVAVYLDKVPTKLSLSGGGDISTRLSLGILALDPIGQADQPAIVGFVPTKFTARPAPAAAGVQPKPFSLFATSNTLLVRDTTSYPASCTPGAGFEATETALRATLEGNCTSLTFTVLFKVVDAADDYTLNLKHWKNTEPGVRLTIVVNGDASTALTKYVDAYEAEGGEANMLSIALRNQDYASVDYSDLLTVGLNSIEITLTPSTGGSAGYALRALSIEST